MYYLNKIKQIFVKYKLFIFRSDLEYAARVFHSDKSHLHNYIPYYYHFFRPFRKMKLQVLEIGIGGYDNPKLGGASLRMWKIFFF